MNWQNHLKNFMEGFQSRKYTEHEKFMILVKCSIYYDMYNYYIFFIITPLLLLCLYEILMHGFYLPIIFIALYSQIHYWCLLLKKQEFKNRFIYFFEIYEGPAKLKKKIIQLKKQCLSYIRCILLFTVLSTITYYALVSDFANIFDQVPILLVYIVLGSLVTYIFILLPLSAIWIMSFAVAYVSKLLEVEDLITMICHQVIMDSALKNKHCQDALQSLLKQCIISYSESYLLLKDANDITGPFIFLLTSAGTGILLSSIFYLTKGWFGIFIFFRSFFTLLTSLLISSTYLFYGQLIINEQEKIYNKLVKCPWYNFNIGNRKIFLMLIFLSQKPIGFNCLKLVYVDYRLFKELGTRIYSWSCVLRDI